MPLPLLLKESSIISIIISTGFPTASLLTILLLGHLVRLAACNPSLLLVQVDVGFDWPTVQLGGIFISSCKGRYRFSGRSQLQRATWKVLQPGKSPCSKEAWGGGWLQEELVTTLDASPGKPGSCSDASPACRGMAGLPGTMAAENLPPLAACGEVGFETATSARRLHRLCKALLPGRVCGAQQSPSQLSGCCICQSCRLTLLLGF